MAQRPLNDLERKVLATAKSLPHQPVPHHYAFSRYTLQQVGWPKPSTVPVSEIQQALRVLLYRGLIARGGQRGFYKLTDEGRRHVP